MNNKISYPYTISSHKETKIGRFEVVQDEIGINGKFYPYSYTIQRDCAVILPICEKKIVLIKEYRHSLGEWMWELPAGSIDDGEAPENAAKRELLEESGYEATILRFFGRYPVSAGTTSLMSYLYVAECRKLGAQKLDDTELIEVKEVDIPKFEEMIRNQEFTFLAGIALWHLYNTKL